MGTKDVIETVAGAAFALFVGWAALGLYGASVGSDDDLTRSFGAAVRWALGTEGGAE